MLTLTDDMYKRSGTTTVLLVNQNYKQPGFFPACPRPRTQPLPKPSGQIYNSQTGINDVSQVNFTPHDRDLYHSFRAVTISNIPAQATLSDVFDLLSGGRVVSALLGNTASITGSNTAKIEFALASSALDFYNEYSNPQILNFNGTPLFVARIMTPTALKLTEPWNIHPRATRSLQLKGVHNEARTAMLAMRFLQGDRLYGRLDKIIYDVDIPGELRLDFVSIADAITLRKDVLMRYRKPFDGVGVEFAADPCDVQVGSREFMGKSMGWDGFVVVEKVGHGNKARRVPRAAFAQAMRPREGSSSSGEDIPPCQESKEVTPAAQINLLTPPTSVERVAERTAITHASVNDNDSSVVQQSPSQQHKVSIDDESPLITLSPITNQPDVQPAAAALDAIIPPVNEPQPTLNWADEMNSLENPFINYTGPEPSPDPFCPIIFGPNGSRAERMNAKMREMYGDVTRLNRRYHNGIGKCLLQLREAEDRLMDEMGV